MDYANATTVFLIDEAAEALRARDWRILSEVANELHRRELEEQADLAMASGG